MPSQDHVPAALTPDGLERIVREIAGERGVSGGSTIAVGAIADRVLAGRVFATPEARVQAQLRIQQEVARLASQLEGLRYLENE